MSDQCEYDFKGGYSIEDVSDENDWDRPPQPAQEDEELLDGSWREAGVPEVDVRDLAGVLPGAAVEHAKFGKGVVSSVEPDDDRIVVDFEEVGIKTFSLKFSIGNGVLKLESKGVFARVVEFFSRR